MQEKSPAIVISDVCGEQGGAYVATLLLCRRLAAHGRNVTCFAGNFSPNGGVSSEEFQKVAPLLRKGWRWDLPFRSLAWQAKRAIRKDRQAVVIAVGLTRLTRMLLQSPAAGRVYVWELTNANPGNKFVDTGAIRLLPRCRALLSPSTTIDEAVQMTYSYRGDIKRLPFWIETAPAPAGDPASEERPDFIYLGRRDPDKGLRELIEATAVVRRKHPGLKICVAGIGDAGPFEELARQSGVLSSMTFQSFPDRRDALAVLSNSKYLVLPSYHEGYPLVLLEAARAGVPSIATTVGSIPSIFADSKACRLIPPRDAGALVEAMEEALTEPGFEGLQRKEAAKTLFESLCSDRRIDSFLAALFED